MTSINKEPFNPFKKGKYIAEESILLNEVISHLAKHADSIYRSKFTSFFENSSWNKEIIFSNFYLSYDQALKFTKVFKDRDLDEISAELAGELILLSVLPIYYMEVGKGKLKDKIKAEKAKVKIYALQKKIQIGKANDRQIRLPDLKGFFGGNVDLDVLFDILNLSKPMEKIFQSLENYHSRVESNLSEEEQTEEFIEKLSSLYYFLEFVESNLPPRSMFEALIVRHLDFIIREEKLISEINHAAKTDARITRFIRDLFRAGGYYMSEKEMEEKDDLQDQMRMVNNAYRSRVKKYWQDKFEKINSCN